MLEEKNESCLWPNYVSTSNYGLLNFFSSFEHDKSFMLVKREQIGSNDEIAIMKTIWTNRS